MIDPDRFAALLCDYCLEARAGQQVVVRSTTLAAPLLLALQRALLEREAWPLLRPSLPGQDAQFWALARDAHLDGFPSLDLAEAEAMDAVVRIDAPENTRALAAVDPARMTRAARARASVREATLARRWCGTLWPTPAGAQQAGMATEDFEAFIRRALFLDRDDPIAAWRELSARQATLVDRLSQASEVRIEAEGTDLTLSVAGRTWINSDGRRNMPSGEVFTGPHETSAEGRIRFAIPSSPRGVEVAGIELEFRAGASWRRAPTAATRSCRRCSPPTTAPACWASWASAPTSAWTARSARSSWTRRWAGPSTSRSGARIPRPAARTSPRSTGT